MSALTAFLLARIAEDETVAREGAACDDDDHAGIWSGDIGWDDLPVMTIHSARVLAECDAKRRIVNLDEMDGGADDGHVHALRCLATIYADHPDYREEWRP